MTDCPDCPLLDRFSGWFTNSSLNHFIISVLLTFLLPLFNEPLGLIMNITYRRINFWMVTLYIRTYGFMTWLCKTAAMKSYGSYGSHNCQFTKPLPLNSDCPITVWQLLKNVIHIQSVMSLHQLSKATCKSLKTEFNMFLIYGGTC